MFEIKKHLKPLMEDESRNIVVVAHRRFGKTSFGIQKTLLEAVKKPRSRYFIILPTYKQAKMVAWLMLNDYCPKEVIDKTNESELSMVLKTGSRIELKGSDYVLDSLKGVGLDGVVLDEYAMQDPSIFSEIIRPSLVDKQGWSVKIGTPKGKNHFYDDFVMSGMKYCFKASQTGILPLEELEQARKEMSEDEANQEFECEFLYFSGQIYREFKRDIHVRKSFPIDNTWLQYASIDYGQVNPTAVLWYAIDYDGRIFVIDEHYEAGKTISYHCQKMRDKGYNLRNLPLLDPSAFARTREKEGKMWSVADEFEDNGYPCIPAPNDVLGGINRVKEYLEQGKLFIFDRCENLIKELETYRWKEKKSKDANAPDEPLKVNDHACDSLRYMILSRPVKPVFPKYQRVLEDRFKELTKPVHSRGDWYSD